MQSGHLSIDRGIYEAAGSRQGETKADGTFKEPITQYQYVSKQNITFTESNLLTVPYKHDMLKC